MEKLDLKDKKLLYWLDQNSRETNKELGKKIGLTEQAIGYRIKRLVAKGVIKKFVTFIDTLSLGYAHYKVFIKLQNTTEEVEKSIINYLVKNQNIRWIVSTSGRYDLSFSILAKTPLDFTKIYQKIEAEYGRYIINKNIVLVVLAPGFTRDFIINKRESKQLEYKSGKEVWKIDEIDKKILKAISQNARENIVNIAEETNSTVDIIKYRLKKLKEKNIINGFTLQLDLENLGYEYYSVFFYVHNFNEEVEKNMINFAKSHSNIQFVVKVIGNHDLQLEFVVKNYTELEQNVKEFRRTFHKSILDFEILRVTKEYKYDFFPFT